QTCALPIYTFLRSNRQSFYVIAVSVFDHKRWDARDFVNLRSSFVLSSVYNFYRKVGLLDYRLQYFTTTARWRCEHDYIRHNIVSISFLFNIPDLLIYSAILISSIGIPLYSLTSLQNHLALP